MRRLIAVLRSRRPLVGCPQTPMRFPQSSSRTLSTSTALALLLTAACGREVEKTIPVVERPNVILISIDTLRPDHLGCYGYSSPTSPNLDQFCEDSIVFEQAVAHAPSTLHSHASILSSLLPHHHQATWGGKTRLPEAATTLAEVLHGLGYSTAAFTGGGQMDRVFGLDQGFESYVQPGEERFMGTVRRGISWLEESRQPPFFLFLHSYEVHHPYEPSPEHLALIEDGYEGDLPPQISIDLLREINRKKLEIGPDDLQHIINTYDAEIRSMDEALGVLVETLRRRGLYDGTLIVFTSDHGEEFGEHGVVGWHSHSLFDELLRVPLIVKLPQAEAGGRRVSAQVRGIDVAPTILAALGIDIPDEFEGVDLRLQVGQTDGGGYDAISRMDRPPGKDISSYRSRDWKLMRKSLYDLNEDPEEFWDLSTSRRDIVEQLETQLEEAIAKRQRLEPEQVIPTDSTLDELRALGYIE